MSVLAPAEAPASIAVRSSALDRLRGLAIALMVLDHVLIVAGTGSGLRETVTRVAMPLFAVLAGHLCFGRRLSRRWLIVAACGVALPLAVPWIDAPNILLIFSVGALMLWAAHCWLGPQWSRIFLGVLVALPLVAHANAWPSTAAGHYDFGSVWALMALGALLSRPLVEKAGAFWPAFLAPVGRYPLSLYVGHLLVLEGVRRA